MVDARPGATTRALRPWPGCAADQHVGEELVVDPPAGGLVPPLTNRAGGVGPYDYTPVPDASGYDAAVTGFRVNPSGAFSGSTGPPDPQFTLQFRVKIK